MIKNTGLIKKEVRNERKEQYEGAQIGNKY